MKQIVLIFTLIFLSVNAFAGKNAININIKGKVLCEGEGVPNVMVTDGISVVETDSEGRYHLMTTNRQQFVYYTLPSGYESPIEDGVPKFYAEIDSVKQSQRFDFKLKECERSQMKHAFVLWADPQIEEESEFNQLQLVINDTKQTIDELSLQQPVHAICVGDLVFDKSEFFGTYKKMIAQLNTPFYHLIGNHDLIYNNRSDELATKSYTRSFGPTNYSFDKGKIHYVILKDVFYYGFTYRYIGYIDENQLNWLEQDLSHIKKGSTVVVSFHIPTVDGESEKTPSYTSTLSNTLMNKTALFKILAPFNAHILTGHSHTQWNTIFSPKLYDHTHAATCAAWWQGELCLNGTPKGYTVYLADGDSLSWYFKGVGMPKDNQFSLYRVGSDSINGNCVIANVYNYDPSWRVEWYENGVKKGLMEQYWGEDPKAKKLYELGKNKKYSWLGVGTTHHLFRATITEKQAKIEVKVTDRFGQVYSREVGQSY